MVRQRGVDEASGGTSGWGGEETHRTIRRSEKPAEIPPKPELEIQIVPEDPKEIAVREGIHKRIQAEIHHEDKEAEEMLEVPLEWNAAPDLMMEDKDVLWRLEWSSARRRQMASAR